MLGLDLISMVPRLPLAPATFRISQLTWTTSIGMGAVPRGLEDVSKFPDLLAELLRRGIPDGAVELIANGNIARVWSEVEKVSYLMKTVGDTPLEDHVPKMLSE